MSSWFIHMQIQEEIIKRVVDVKSLLRFRSVSKQWKCSIDSPELIGHHYNVSKQTHPPNWLVSYSYSVADERYASIVDDDDSFLHNKFNPIPPPNVKLSVTPVIIGCSHGLVCLSSRDHDPLKQKQVNIVVWNPSIRKSVGIKLPLGKYVIGFGVCPKTLDPKIVKIPKRMDRNRKAEVFSVSTGAWKSVHSLPPKLEGFFQQQVVIDGAIHWSDSDLIGKDYRHRIESFDLTSEKFGPVQLLPPDIFPHQYLSIFKLKESLALLSKSRMDDDHDVWMMMRRKNSNGAGDCSFTKLYSVRLLAFDGLAISKLRVHGSRKNGELMMGRIVEWLDATDHRRVFSVDYTLEVYEPYTQHSKELGFGKLHHMFFTAASYTESLLMLNQTELLYVHHSVFDRNHYRKHVCSS